MGDVSGKKGARIRRGKKVRARIKEQNINRLCIHRTGNHIYAQIIDASGANVLASASTVQPDIKNRVKSTGNIEAATVVGSEIAQKATNLGIIKVAFDRSGFRYHGRIKALAEAARIGGMQF